MKNRKLSNLCDDTINICYGVIEEVSTFNIFEWEMLEIALLSMGALIGSTFSPFFKKIRPLMIVLTAVTYGYTVWRLITNISLPKSFRD